MTEKQFQTPFGNCHLNRDVISRQPNLRAWDAADEYLLDEFSKHPKAGILVANDQFGGLTVPLSGYVNEIWTDSFLSTTAITDNITANNLPLNIHFIPAHQQPRSSPSLAIVRIPKNNTFFAWQLCCLHNLLTVGTELWLGGMEKHISKSQFELVDKLFGPVKFLPGWKKARIWKAHKADERHHAVELFKPGFNLAKYDLTLVQTPNVFSGAKADQGSLFLLEQLPDLTGTNTIADIGCGNGLLSLAVARQYPDIRISAIDESYQAVACCCENARLNHCDNIHGSVANALAGFAANSFDKVLCNPPFHQGTTLTEHLAHWMFKTTARTLTNGGELWVVANRHLDYPRVLKSIFGNCHTAKQNSRFKVYRVSKN